MFSEDAVEWNGESFCNDWEDAKALFSSGRKKFRDTVALFVCLC